MRARHRHFNPAHAGANSCYDARFLALANNDAVADWTDRSANARTASQSTAANRPVYKTAVQGGSPAVRFDGGNDQLLTSSYALPTACSVVSVAQANSWSLSSGSYKGLATHAYVAAAEGSRGLGFGYLAPSAAAGWQSGDILFFGSGYSTAGPRAYGASASGSDFRVVSCVLGSTTARGWSNSARVSTRVETTNTMGARTEEFVIGGKKGSTAEGWNGDIGCLSYFHTEISDSLRRRTEHAAAYSFKISCN